MNDESQRFEKVDFEAPELSEDLIDAEENKAISGALSRLKRRANEVHNSHYTKHSSHSVKHSSGW